jgi:hypothetical protein
MTNQTFNKLMDDLKELHNSKNHDYATEGNPYSNFQYAADLSNQFTDPVDKVFATLIGVKLARLGELRGKGKKPRNEPAFDTMRDLTCYMGIWTSYVADSSIKGIDADRAWATDSLGLDGMKQGTPDKRNIKDRFANAKPGEVIPVTKQEFNQLIEERVEAALRFGSEAENG